MSLLRKSLDEKSFYKILEKRKEKREALSLWSTIHLHLKVFLYSADAAKMEPKSGRDKVTQRLTNVAVVQNGRIDIGTSL